MYKCIKDNKFPTHKKLILDNMTTHNYATRYRELLCPPFQRLEICKNSFLYKGIYLWNELDNITKDLKTMHSFKNAIKCKIFDDLD